MSFYEVETHLLIIIPDAGISESLGGLADAARLLAGSRWAHWLNGLGGGEHKVTSLGGRRFHSIASDVNNYKFITI